MARTVLLIEDNEQNRYLATYLVEERGFYVESAPDGFRGVEHARTMQPDLILLDIRLPGMDGYEVARALRGVSGLGATPIIPVTSYAMVGDREKSLAAGCTGYIEQPIDPETFVAEVARLAGWSTTPAES